MDSVRPTKSEVREYLARSLIEIGKISPQRIVDGASLSGDLKMESIAFIEMQVAVEERFEIEIDALEILDRNEFGAIVDYVYDCIRERYGSVR